MSKTTPQSIAVELANEAAAQLGPQLGALPDAEFESVLDQVWSQLAIAELTARLGSAGIEAEPDDVRDVFVGALCAAYGRAAPVDTIRLEWSHVGPKSDAAPVPPNAVSVADYILVWDPAREAIVYAMSPDYHQFGHAWARVDDRWTPVCEESVRLGDAAQIWQGFYDSGRKAIVAWNFDDEAPVAAVLDPSGIRLLAASADAGQYSEGVAIDTYSGEAPVGEHDDWEDLVGVFGYDRNAQLTVCVTAGGVHTLNNEGTWRRAGDAGELPDEVNGDRNFGGAGAGAYWDTPRERLVFWFWDGDEDELVLRAFTGDGLAPVSTDGLPDDLHSFFGEKGFSLGQSEKDGALLYAGPELGAFTPTDDGWIQSRHGRAGPPRHKGANIVAGPKTVILGPGSYDPDGEQNVFYVRTFVRWVQDGSVKRKSLLDKVRSSGGWPVMAFAESTLYAVAWRDDLRTLEWSDGQGWEEIVDPETGEAIHDSVSEEHRAALLAGPGGHLHAVFKDGAVLRLVDDEWQPVVKASADFGVRFDFATGFDGRHLVVFGGQVKNRWSNDTLRLNDGGWVKLPKSARPSSLKDDFHLVQDGGLGTMVRFGPEVSVLGEDDIWVTVEVPGYHPDCRPFAHGDEVLLLSNGRFSRFDLAGITAVADQVLPQHIIEARERDRHGDNRFPYPPDFAFDSATATLQTSKREDAEDNWRVDLSPAFTAAAALGPRTSLTPAVPEAWRYRGDQIWYAAGAGPVQIEVDGSPAGTADSLADATLAAEAEGWQSADQVEPEKWLARFGRKAHALKLTDGDPGTSHLGGRPNGIEWPAGLGLLAQIELPEGLVDGAAAVAVFIPIDGTTTENIDNIAVLLTAEQLAAAPTQSPDDVAELPATRFSIGDPVFERDDAALGHLPDDAVLASAIDDLPLVAPQHDKLGGHPEWVQYPETDAPLILQLDFDRISFDDAEKAAWPDAGLFGALYVFATPDGPEVLWQYT